jgi:PIN domain nuclease of toxin-antitoxin system
VLPVTPEIALASTESEPPPGALADRLSATTAAINKAALVTVDERLRESQAVKVLR